jgi:hypothetical protein
MEQSKYSKLNAALKLMHDNTPELDGPGCWYIKDTWFDDAEEAKEYLHKCIEDEGAKDGQVKH